MDIINRLDSQLRDYQTQYMKSPWYIGISQLALDELNETRSPEFVKTGPRLVTILDMRWVPHMESWHRMGFKVMQDPWVKEFESVGLYRGIPIRLDQAAGESSISLVG